MENKKPKPSTGFHGNQYVDSQGRHRATTITNKTGGKKSGGKK